jgi:hypothetical protein
MSSCWAAAWYANAETSREEDLYEQITDLAAAQFGWVPSFPVAMVSIFKV